MDQRLRALLVFGTRPEAIKLAPVVEACREWPERIEPIVCLTGQHREMLRQMVDYFHIKVDHELAVMQADQSLSSLTARCLDALDKVMCRRRPHCVVVQGDTTTAMSAALVAFYHRLPVVHVEAGLRTDRLDAPWPEEFNRRVVDMLAALYCAPTERAAERLRAEGVPPEAVRVTGNTVVDALLQTLQRERARDLLWRQKHAALSRDQMVLVTGHRRENFGRGMENICRAIRALAERFPDCDFVYPVHLNPRVREPVFRLLGNLENVHLLPPVDYPEFVWLMDRAVLILTDSGGVQEEAPSLGKPVLVMRETTERPEAVEAGLARLVGTSAERIVAEAASLLARPPARHAEQTTINLYGDGQAAKRIVQWMLEEPWQKAHLPTRAADRIGTPAARPQLVA